jgi:hypothetical protein
MQKILNSGNSKTAKGEKKGWKTFGIHLAPSKVSGFNVCKWASKGCAMACLNTAGRGAMKNVQEARIKKTIRVFKDRKNFMAQLADEITKAAKSAARKQMQSCFRLNLTSDLPWENMKHFDGASVFEKFKDQIFYDYTKSRKRMEQFLAGELPKNYSLTLSRSEDSSDLELAMILGQGGNVAIVFRGELPKNWNGYEVIDGDESDLRFLDKKGVVVGLVEKGLAKKDKSGFVVEPLTC